MSYGELSPINRTGVEEFLFEWSIPNFSSMCPKSINYYHSPNIKFCGSEWYFKFFPYRRNERRNPAEGWVGVSLFRFKPQTLRITVGIKGSRGVEMERGIEIEDSCCRGCIFGEFCLRSEMLEQKSRLLPNDILTITCYIKVAGAVGGEGILQRSEQSALLSVRDSEATLKEQGMEELKESMKTLLKSGKDTDVVIKVQGKEFPAHRLLLQARSPVFEAMLSHDMAEKLRGVVTVEDCDQETFLKFLEHVYTGSIEMVSAENVFSLYTASDKYDLTTLKKACAEFVKKNLTVASFCDAVTLAVKYDEKDLIELTTEFFCSNSLDICKTNEWQIFLKENTTVGNELLIKAFSK